MHCRAVDCTLCVSLSEGCTVGLWTAPCVTVWGVHCGAVDCTLCHCLGVHCRAVDCTLCVSLSEGCTVGLWTAPCVCHCLRGALWGCGLHPVCVTV